MGCVNLGLLHQNGIGTPRDDVQAARIFERACEDLGSGEACASLGFLLAQGRGRPVDAAKAAALYERGCKKGVGTACGNLGGLYQRGRRVTADEVRALEYFHLGCKRRSTSLHANKSRSIHVGAPGARDDDGREAPRRVR